MRDLDGGTSVLGVFVSEALVTNLFAAKQFEIVERAMLDEVIKELKLGQTGLIDPETVKKVGKVTGVDAIVTGTITDLQSYVALNCRLIDTQTGRIFGAAQTNIVKDDDVKKIMTEKFQDQGEASRILVQNDSTKKPAETFKSSRSSQQVNGFLVELEKCTIRSNLVECDLLITNTEEDRDLGIEAYNPWGINQERRSRLIDERGDEFPSTPEISLGSINATQPHSTLVSGVPTRARVSFDFNSPPVGPARLVEISCWRFDRHNVLNTFKVQFRDVPLVRN